VKYAFFFSPYVRVIPNVHPLILLQMQLFF
jgi:hypothetical protein